MRIILEFFDKLVEKLGDDFSWENENNEKIPCFDYMDEQIPLARVLEDREKCVSFVEEQLATTDDNSQKELVLAVYCNFYIKHGMVGRFQLENREEAYDGLSNFFAGLSPKEMYLQGVYQAVRNQDFTAWKEILEINKNSIVAKIYSFQQLVYAYGQDAKDADEKQLNVDEYKELWELYESLPESWKQYVIGEGNLIRASQNHAMDMNLLPYVEFVSVKEILMEYIPEYYFSALEKLGIRSDIDSEDAYAKIIDALGIREVEDFLMKEVLSRLNHSTKEEMPIVMLECATKLLERTFHSVEQFHKADEGRDMTFLFEKLHDLQYEGYEAWIDSKEILEECAFFEMYPVLRISYLHLPVRIPVKKSLFLSHYDVFLKNRTIQKNARQKQEMMDYYAHSWKHISYPQIVKEIAEELGKSNRSIANRLMKVYNSERTLQRGIQLLQYISSEDEAKVSKEFKNGIAKSGTNSEKSVPLSKVIADSLDLVIFKILMVESDDSNSIERCRQKWCLKKSLSELMEEYTEWFLEGESDNSEIVEWVSDNFIRMDICLNADWESVRFRDDSFALNQFKEILVEIFTNAFLHGEESMTLRFGCNEEEMFLYAENPCDDVISGSRSGLSTLEKVLQYINFGTEIESLSTQLGDRFGITIRLNKKLLIRKGR